MGACFFSCSFIVASESVQFTHFYVQRHWLVLQRRFFGRLHLISAQLLARFHLSQGPFRMKCSNEAGSARMSQLLGKCPNTYLFVFSWTFVLYSYAVRRVLFNYFYLSTHVTQGTHLILNLRAVGQKLKYNQSWHESMSTKVVSGPDGVCMLFV